jgi:hypothetical protein
MKSVWKSNIEITKTMIMRSLISPTRSPSKLTIQTQISLTALKILIILTITSTTIIIIIITIVAVVTAK